MQPSPPRSAGRLNRRRLLALALAVGAGLAGCERKAEPSAAPAPPAPPPATVVPAAPLVPDASGAVAPAAPASPAVQPAEAPAAPSPSAAEVAPVPVPVLAYDPASLAGKLEAAKATHGGLLIIADRKGIHALAPDLSLVADLSPARANHLRVVQSASQLLLYFVVPAKRQIVRLDLVSGSHKVLATLPLLQNECFRGAIGPGPEPEGQPTAAGAAQDPTATAAPAEGAVAAAEGVAPAVASKPVNPLDYIQGESDFGVDPAGKFACFQISDRNANMANVMLSFRVDLTSGKTTERVVFGGEECQTLVKGVPNTKPLCTIPAVHAPRPAPTQPWPFNAKALHFDAEATSDSGRFGFLRDAEVVAEQGDYVYLAPFVFDAQTGTVLVVTSKTLVPANLAKLRKSQKLPKNTLVFPGEAGAFWLAGADVLVLGDGGSASADMTLPTTQFHVVTPPDKVKMIKAFAATTF